MAARAGPDGRACGVTCRAAVLRVASVYVVRQHTHVVRPCHTHRDCAPREGVASHSRLAGFFQRDSGQYSCINCDNVGNFYQQETSATVRRGADNAENNTPMHSSS